PHRRRRYRPPGDRPAAVVRVHGGGGVGGGGSHARQWIGHGSPGGLAVAGQGAAGAGPGRRWYLETLGPGGGSPPGRCPLGKHRNAHGLGAEGRRRTEIAPATPGRRNVAGAWPRGGGAAGDVFMKSSPLVRCVVAMLGVCSGLYVPASMANAGDRVKV